MMITGKATRIQRTRLGVGKTASHRRPSGLRKALAASAYGEGSSDPQLDQETLPEELESASAPQRHDGVYVTMSRLVDLSREEEGDIDATRPTEHALNNTLLLLIKAFSRSGAVPPGSPSVDSRGGIRLTFRNDKRELRLICPASEIAPASLYYQGESGRDVEDATIENLARRFQWLLGESAAERPTD